MEKIQLRCDRKIWIRIRIDVKYWIGSTGLTNYAPLFLIVLEVFFYAGKTHIGHFEEFFEGAKTFLTPKLTALQHKMKMLFRKFKKAKNFRTIHKNRIHTL
jgi:hypothetical protein